MSLQYPSTLEQAFDEVVAELRRLMVMRQRKYGPTNIQNGGGVGVALRISDKSSRLMQAYGLPDDPHLPNEHFSDESLTDTLADTANHAIIGLLLQRGQWGLPLESTVLDELHAKPNRGLSDAVATPASPAKYTTTKARGPALPADWVVDWVAQPGSKAHDPFLTADMPGAAQACAGCGPDCKGGRCVSG